MNTTLKEFLDQKAIALSWDTDKNRELITDWQEAVKRLFAQLELWIGQADPHKLIECDYDERLVNEPGLGRYEIARLEIRTLGKWIGVIPKARTAIRVTNPAQTTSPERATGRVDITDELRRFVLYRFGIGENEKWYVDDPTLTSELEELSAKRFESILLSYLL